MENGRTSRPIQKGDSRMKIGKSIAVAIALTAGASMVMAPASFAATSGSSGGHGVIEYAVASQTQLDWFFPLNTASSDTVPNQQLIDQLYKPMLWVNNNYTINWKSSIARKVTYNKAGTVYHVFLNPKWHWSNGMPVTSKDVMFTWNVIKAASATNAPAPWPFVGEGTGDIPQGIKSIVPNGNYELTITLDKPANQQWFEYNGIIQLTPMPAVPWDRYPSNMTKEIKYLAANGSNPMFDTVVDGPFKIVSGVPGQGWTLVPNPKYDGHKSTLRKLVFVYEASNTSELAALKSGQINVGYLDQSQLGSEPALTRMGDVVKPVYGFGIFWTEMNMWPGSPTKSIFDHLYVRQALQMGEDINGIDTDIYKGYATSIYGPIAPIPATKFLDPKLAKPIYPFNIAAGTKLLEKHGWKMVHGVLTKGKQQMKFQLMYVSGLTSTTEEVEVMQEDWKKEGIDVSLKGVPFSTFVTITSNKKDHQWGLAVGSGWDYNGPGFYPTGGQLFATNAPSGTGFSNSMEDKLIAATHVPYANEAITMKHFMAYEDYTARILPFLWLNNPATLTVVAPDVHNVFQYLDGATAYPQMQYWTVS
jgi:peptide/nickel transport system substrate-binding protein